MKLNRDDIEGIAVSLGVHLLILLFLIFWIIKTAVPAEGGGVMVNFGTIDAASGTFIPGNEPGNDPDYVPRQVTPPPTLPTPEPETITQDYEESVAVSEAKKKADEKKRQEELARQQEQVRLQQAEQKRLEEQRKQQEIQNRVAGAFGKGDGDGASQGTAESGTGNQGSPFGNAEEGANEGVGGTGGGTGGGSGSGTGIGSHGSFSLDGRSIGAGGLPRPAYTIQEEGKIVVSITVDPKGVVISAAIGRGTNIDNASMRNAALEAARKARFNSIGGTNNQTGTITYNYRLK